MVTVFVVNWASQAFATDRFFSDITVTSPDRHYRLEAKSPDNADGKRRPFQGNFTYTFSDAITKKVVWTYLQAEASPVSAWVSDEGWTVVRTGWNELLAFSPVDGKRTARVEILKQFPPDEADRYVHQTSAGPMWSKSSRWYFMPFDGRPHFVVRSWWGRRVIVELASGSVIADKGEVHDAATKVERAEIISVLRIAASEGEPPNARGGSGSIVDQVLTAAQLAGREHIEEVVPYLTELQRWSYSGRSTSWNPFHEPIPEGAISPFVYSEHTVRSTAQTALRRLGAEPLSLPVTEFRYYHKDYNKQRPVTVRLKGERSEHVDKVAAGMTPLAVLKAINAPDAVAQVGSTQAWEYDIDATEPYTFQVFWTLDNPPIVAKVARLIPPRWKSGDSRDDR